MKLQRRKRADPEAKGKNTDGRPSCGLESEEVAMTADPAFWRNLRVDFEGLKGQKFSLLWSSNPQPPLEGHEEAPGDSQWSWWHYPNASLLARFVALAIRGARGLGHDSEDDWYDQLRASHFVRFKKTGVTQDTDPEKPDVRRIDDVGRIDDVVRESITLCHQLEAGLKDRDVKPARRKRRAPINGIVVRTGPKPDYETAKRVAAAVEQVAPHGDWRSKWAEIAEALDKEEIPCPSTWTKKSKGVDRCTGWADQLEKSLVVKAIDYRLKQAARAK